MIVSPELFKPLPKWAALGYLLYHPFLTRRQEVIGWVLPESRLFLRRFIEHCEAYQKSRHTFVLPFKHVSYVHGLLSSKTQEGILPHYWRLIEYCSSEDWPMFDDFKQAESLLVERIKELNAGEKLPAKHTL